MVQEQDSAAAQQYSRQGCPTGLRAELWALILNSTNQPQVRRALAHTRSQGCTGVEADTICYEAGAAAAFPNTACLLLGFSVAALFISSPDWESDVKTEPWAPVDLSSSCETLSFSPSAVYYSWLRFCPHVQTLR